ncbi:hypothetical protein BJX64DRAFT_258017 [Aspergillus heterothallicus]
MMRLLISQPEIYRNQLTTICFLSLYIVTTRCLGVSLQLSTEYTQCLGENEARHVAYQPSKAKFSRSARCQSFTRPCLQATVVDGYDIWRARPIESSLRVLVTSKGPATVGPNLPHARCSIR